MSLEEENKILKRMIKRLLGAVLTPKPQRAWLERELKELN